MQAIAIYVSLLKKIYRAVLSGDCWQTRQCVRDANFTEMRELGKGRIR